MKRLESNSQPQTHRTAVVDAFLAEGLQQLAEVLIAGNIGDHRLEGSGSYAITRVDAQVEVAEQRESAPAAAVISVRRKQWMVEDVINICPDLGRPAFPEMKVLVNAEIDTPGSGPVQHVPWRDIGVAEEVRANRRQIECVGIKDLVANAVIGVAGHDGPIARLDVEIADRVRRSYANVAGRNREAVIANPERGEAATGLGKHVEAGLPSTDHCVGPLGERATELVDRGPPADQTLRRQLYGSWEQTIPVHNRG